MSLIVQRPKSGNITHIYESGGDGRSLCGRAPYYEYGGDVGLEHITCWRCKRAFEILDRNPVQGTDRKPDVVKIDIPKKKTVKKSRSIKGSSSRQSSGTGKSHSRRGNRK